MKIKRPEMNAKTELAKELFAVGHTYATIGRIIGVSRQRAQQLVKPPKMVTDYLKKRSGGKCENCKVILRQGQGHVHHMKRKTPVEFNGVKNLQYLCPSCHKLADSALRKKSA